MNNSMLTYTDMPDEVLDRILHDVQHGLPENPLGRVEIALGMLCNVGERINAMAARFDAIDANPEVPKWLEDFCAREEKILDELSDKGHDDGWMYRQGEADMVKQLRIVIGLHKGAK